MIYQSENMTYYSVMDVFKGKLNDVVICETLNDGRSSYFTVLVIKKHSMVKRLIKLIEQSDKGNDFCIESFWSENNFCIVFDYVKERKLSEFYMAGENTLETCEEICISLLIQCMISKLPYPILYLVLTQNQIHLLKDNSVALGYSIDLEELDENCTEANCAMQCAILIRGLLEKKANKKNISYKLLIKKIPKQRYFTFRELYKDILLSSSVVKKRGLKNKISDKLARNYDTIFRVILTVSIILAVITIIVILSEAIMGDIPILRLFYNSFEKIGTESLIG